jgi:hypothetical protein
LGLLRVPFVRRCRLDLEEPQESRSAFIVNLSVFGAYIAEDQQPKLGKRGVCVFSLPGNALEVGVKIIVAWVNPAQKHPVHSLPPGYGLRFLELTDDVRVRIEDFVRDTATRGAPPSSAT